MPGGRKADERQAENDGLPTKVLATAESLGAVNTRPGDAWERGCCEPRARNLLMGPVTMMGRRVETGGGEVCGSLREVARKARYVTVVGGIRTADRRENLFIVRPGEEKTAPVLAAHSWTAALLNGLWKTPERRSWADRGADQNIWSSRAAGLGCQSTVKARKHGFFFFFAFHHCIRPSLRCLLVIGQRRHRASRCRVVPSCRVFALKWWKPGITAYYLRFVF